MFKRFKKILFSVPSMTVVGIIAAYLVLGFLVLPALLQWQIEKQIADRGHVLQVQAVRFNPLELRLEVDRLALQDAAGKPLFAFAELVADLQWRGVVDGAWTFADVRVREPVVQFELMQNGRHNSGQVRAVDLGAAAVSLQAPGAGAPLLAAKTVALNGGHIDLARHEARFARFAVAQGGVALALDAQGRGDWSGIVRVAPQSDTPGASTPSARGKPASSVAAATWRVAIDDARIDAMAFDFRDPARTRSASLAALSLVAAPRVTIGAGASQVALDKLQLQLSGLQLGEGAGMLSIPKAQLDLGKTALDVTGGAIRGHVFAPRLVLAQGVTARDGERNASVGATSLESGGVTVATAAGDDATAQLTVEAPRLRLQSLSAAQSAGQSARLDEITWRARQMALQSGVDVQTLALDASALALRGLRAAADGQQMVIAAVTVDHQSLSSSLSDKGMQLEVLEPMVLLTDVLAQRGEERAKLATLRLQGTRVQIASQDARTALSLGGLVATGTTLALQRASDSLDLAALALGSETLSLNLDAAGMRAAGGQTRASVKGVMARQGGHDLALKEATLRVSVVDASSVVPATGGPAANLARLGTTVLTLDTVVVDGAGAPAGLVGLSAARLAAGDLALALVAGPLSLTGKAIDLNLDRAVLRDPADRAVSLLQLGSAALSGASFSLSERLVGVDKLVLDQAGAALWLDAKGQLNLIDRFGAGIATAPAGAAAESEARADNPGPVAAPRAPAWRVVVRDAELNNTSLAFEDRRQSPPLALGLDDVGVRITSLDTAAATPMQIEASASIRSGGTVQAQGSVAPLGSAADLQVTATGVALVPVQAYLSEFAELKLASGSASTKGRLLFGNVAGNKARLSYAGGFSVDQLLLEEITPSRPFLSFVAVRSGDLALTIEPNRLDIGEVQIDKPDGRLIIAADQSINLTDVLKKRPPSETQETEVAAAQAAAAPPADVFPVTIARLRVADGQLEFADLSLRPRFGTRMHGLKGVITGLGTDVNRSAKLQLDARVDQFGSARIRGQVSVFQPEKLTDIAMAFRNLEMKSLSPYTAKFAGYEIASGKLSLDLQYKVRDRKLLGENKVVLNQLELGKKVESADALDLPLELALAILKDAKGVIDIGLPVRGDLADPRFDYGAVIAKAIGNLLGGIVTAPFRALAALFGGGDSEIDSIAFEPGGDHLAPPERQKLETVARALKERPNLKLKVDPVFATEQDTSALQSLLVRGDIIRRMGLEVVAGEDPGPVDAANPRVPAAVETIFSQRYAPQVLALLKARAPREQALATTPAQAVSEAAPVDGNSAAQAPLPRPTASAALTAQGTQPVAPPKPPPIPAPAFYQGLIDRLVKEQVVSDEMLGQLALRRADAVVQALTGENGVAPGRVERGEPRKAQDASDTVVPLKLQLEAAK